MKTAKKVFRDIMSQTPAFVRRALTKLKIDRELSFLMPVEEVLKCDCDPGFKEAKVEEYRKKHPKITESLERKINRAFEHYPRRNSSTEKELKELKAKMEYAFFGYGFRPDEFLFFDLGGANSSPDRLRTFVSETERYSFRLAANDFSDSLFADKADTYKRFAGFYQRDAVIIDSDGDLQRFLEFVEKYPRFVYKQVSSKRGNGVKLIEKVEDKKGFFRLMRNSGKALLEECIIQSPEFAAFNRSSVNTLRLSTYNTRSGVIIAHGFFRTGRAGSFIDNAAKGGVFAPIDVENGCIISDGYDEYGNVYISHSDSGIDYRGFRFPDWEEAGTICRSIAEEMPAVKYISFDLAHTDKGWVIVEINPSGQFIHQVGQSENFREKLRGIINNMDLMVPYKLREYPYNDER